MLYYVSWISHDPEYQEYDADCALLVSPIHQPKSWHIGKFRRLPKRLMLDSGSFRLFRRPDGRVTSQEVLDSQLRALQDYWKHMDVTICHYDHPVVGSTVYEENLAIEATIANAYELKAEVLRRPECIGLRGNVNFLGVIQGTTPESIRFCAHGLLSLGFFNSFGLGSLAQLNDPKQLTLRVEAAKSVLGDRDLHVFGVSSLEGMRRLRQLGVKSIDSSRPMRAAIACTIFYGTPLRGYIIKGTLRRGGGFISRRKECDCPICRTYGRDLMRVGRKTYNNYRAVHNYLRLKHELGGADSDTLLC